MYEKLKPQPKGAPAGALVVTLDTGATVMIRIKATRLAGGAVAVRSVADQVEIETLDPITDASDAVVDSSAAHTFCATDISTLTLAACTREMVLLVLGEPPQLFGAALQPLDGSVLASYSIRTAITAADYLPAATDLAQLI
jgi:hypothetical protein